MVDAEPVLKPRMKISVLRAPDGFRDALVEWFVRNGRDYPWRRTRDPYEILVSEVMLQQTRIATVLGRGFYTRFLETFPNVATLATADDDRLLKAWEGLGYYRRARMLRATAQAVIADHGGVFPSELAALLRLPGIGRYTAGALRAFAFHLPAVVVDGNVARVISRVMDFRHPVDDSAGQAKVFGWAERLADGDRPQVYHSALMELGQTICRVGVPDCLACPVAGFCKSRDPEALPVKRPRPKPTEVDEHGLWIRDPEGRLLLHQEDGARRNGLWKLPTRTAAEISLLPILHEHRYTITRYRVTLRVHDGAHPALRGFQVGPAEIWRTPEEISSLPMPSPFRRVIDHLSGEF